MSEPIETFNGEYLLPPHYRSEAAVIVEVRHVLKAGGQRIYTPVAHLSAFHHPSADLINPHWSLRLFVRSDVRYEETTHTTTVVSNPERQAGTNQAMLHVLRALAASKLPSVHPKLAEQIVVSLKGAGLIAEPAMLHLCEATELSATEFGSVFAIDDDA
jgi:hypothetical protein